MAGDALYRNPILPGFHSDPSVVRVGEDYYLVTSTCQYFPAMTIQHSRDLVHWRIIGHGITDPEFLDLSASLDGCGTWAPDLTWHDGTFYLSLCLVELTKDRSVNRRGNYLARSTRPEGPYSRPVQLTDEGNDPSLFFDDEGTPYLLYAPGMPAARGTKIVQLNRDCTAAVGEPWWMEWGDEKRAPEGPHLLRKDGWYYHLMACGGIGPMHQERVARSRSLHGPWETNPDDPFLFQRDPKAKIQLSGHGKLVQTPGGDWWLVSLSQRPLDGIAPLGRETALDRVTWVEGWPVVNGGFGPCEVGLAPSLPVWPWPPEPTREDFDRPNLGLSWLTVRTPCESDRSLTERPGFLRLWTGPGRLCDLATRNTTVRRETTHAYTATLALEFSPTVKGPQAGLTCYYDTTSHVQLGLEWDGARKFALWVQGAGERWLAGELPAGAGATQYLRIVVEGLWRSFLVSGDGRDWTLLARLECRFLSDQGTLNWPFTGTMVGVFATAADSGVSLAADFDWFEVAQPEPGPPTA